MAVVARALAEDQVEHDKTGSIMARIYDVADSPRGQELMRAIIEAARASKASAAEFATAVGNTCLRHGGDMDSVLGVKL